ncbi:MAG TPA: phosphoenolpyruvate synthase [Candidatus Saccharimonadia bacterium]|nr:phosphoenolpyruvate synthase [Candidatus Saccharimonadia bacterium]
MAKPAQHVVWFKDVDKDSGALVGGKGANLGEMVANGFPVPNGFIVTAPAYFYVLDHNKLRDRIRGLLKGVDVSDPRALDSAAKNIKKLISQAEVPDDLAKEIIQAYQKLGEGSPVAVRSSATAEDLPGASFAGQQATFLNIAGDANVVNAIRDAWASLFEARAIFYRVQKGFDHFKVGLAVPVQKMVQSEVSGVMFSMNPVNNDKETIVIEAIWGLGENIVQGAVTPDHYEVNKHTWKLVKKEKIKQVIEMVSKEGKTKDYPVPSSRQDKIKLSDAQILELAHLSQRLQQHYFFPQDSEWALEDGKLYLVQTRPITTIQNIDTSKVDSKKTEEEVKRATVSMKLLVKGDSASPGLVSGIVRFILSPKEIHRLKVGEIMVTSMTTPDFVPAMKKAAALVTDKGGQTSHAAIVSREMGLPCVVGTGDATKKLKEGRVVTVNGKTGEVFEGSLPANVIADIATATRTGNAAAAAKSATQKTATKVYVNLAEPELAEQTAARNVDGIGLLRAEFMLAGIGTHPKKLIHDHHQQVFIHKLADDMEKFCKAFAPRPVIYRATDFKTNEYRNLVGGKDFEPYEENPMIGYRGAFRYISDEAVFRLELEAIKRVRNVMGYKNLWLMIPFVRTVSELIRVKHIVNEHGLYRGVTFRLWMMAEIPSNVVMLDEFIDVGIDGVSIGTNDLTMLMLGVDRDNEHVASEYDERNPAVLWALEQICTKGRKRGITVSVCGNAPSKYPDITEKLVEWGATSVSVTPDMIDRTREVVYEVEKRIAAKKK